MRVCATRCGGLRPSSLLVGRGDNSVSRGVAAGAAARLGAPGGGGGGGGGGKVLRGQRVGVRGRRLGKRRVAGRRGSSLAAQESRGGGGDTAAAAPDGVVHGCGAERAHGRVAALHEVIGVVHGRRGARGDEVREVQGGLGGLLVSLWYSRPGGEDWGKAAGSSPKATAPATCSCGACCG